MTTGEKIKQLRMEKGWTQEELAKRCGYSGKSVISKTETSGDDVKSSKILRIASALGVNPERLVEWDNKDIYDNSEDVNAIQNFMEVSGADMIHQLRLYADFLKNRGELL